MDQEFDSDCFKCAHFLWTIVIIMNSQLKGNFPIIDDSMAFSYSQKKLNEEIWFT